jgi:uncharacterized UBP type Zn finger protein
MKEDASGKIPAKKMLEELKNSGRFPGIRCRHVDGIKEVSPSAVGCEDCLKIGDSWVHLRVCLECGHVGCCDDSKNKHASRHNHETGHPIIASYEVGEVWIYCYPDHVGFEL